jgi:membrane associated rhomboid family serine protease
MFNPYGRSQYEFTKSWTFYLIVVNIIFFIAEFLVPGFRDLLALTPTLAFSGYFFQFITYMFIHGGIMHIFWNMFILLIFGFVVERFLGAKKFLIVYLLSGVGSSLVYILFTGISNIPLIGASGAVFGILAAYAFLFPKSWVFMFGVFPMPAWLLIVFLLVEETFFGALGLQPGIANFGHVGGIVTGLLIMFYWKYKKIQEERMRDFKFIWE